MSEQLSAELMYSLQGVRLVGGSCYLSFTDQKDADASRTHPLTLRGLRLHLEDAASGTSVLLLSGVSHEASDDAVTMALSVIGSVVGRKLINAIINAEGQVYGFLCKIVSGT